jgi:membrane-associated phospholipid phosphatase
MRMQLQAPARRDRRRTATRRTATRQAHPARDWKIIAIRLVGGLVAVWALISLLGLLETHVLNSGPVHRADLGVDVWLAAHRTAFWNTATLVGTTMATTITVIAVTAAVALLLRWLVGRWHESLVLVTVMVGEIVLFLAAAETIHQNRPPVQHLDKAPPTSSYPSGHTAAAVALYGSLAVLVIWIYGRRPAARIVAALLALVPFFVGFSRLYRGMHYPSDVIAGALLGGLWLLLVMTTLLRRQPRPAVGSGPGSGTRADRGTRHRAATRR